MSQLFGNFIETANKQIHLVIKLSFSLLPIEQNWRNNSRVADFIADYWQIFFSSKNIPRTRRAEIREATSFIANELLENAMKSAYASCNKTICISLSLSDETLSFYITNSIMSHSVKDFQGVINNLLTDNPQDMYIRQLISNSEEKNQDISRLGFLTILCNYDTQLAWKFEAVSENPMFTAVTTMVQLTITN